MFLAALPAFLTAFPEALGGMMNVDSSELKIQLMKLHGFHLLLYQSVGSAKCLARFFFCSPARQNDCLTEAL
jgi:hypothetical protein